MDYIIDTENGKVFNKRGYEIGKWQNNGNIIVTLNGEIYTLPRLIWETVNGKIPEGYIVTHIDGDKTNNSISNLALTTKKKSVIQLSQDGETIKEYASISEVVEDGYTISNVSRCCRGIFQQYKGYFWKFK